MLSFETGHLCPVFKSSSKRQQDGAGGCVSRPLEGKRIKLNLSTIARLGPAGFVVDHSPRIAVGPREIDHALDDFSARKSY